MKWFNYKELIDIHNNRGGFYEEKINCSWNELLMVMGLETKI